MKMRSYPLKFPHLYSDFEALDAPHGTIPYPNTDVQLKTQRIGEDLYIIVSKNGFVVYEEQIEDVFRRDLIKPSP